MNSFAKLFIKRTLICFLYEQFCKLAMGPWCLPRRCRSCWHEPHSVGNLPWVLLLVCSEVSSMNLRVFGTSRMSLVLSAQKLLACAYSSTALMLRISYNSSSTCAEVTYTLRSIVLYLSSYAIKLLKMT
jgi:hypothetical protein